MYGDHQGACAIAISRILLVRVGSQLVGLPLEYVRETMRPLPLAAVTGPGFVLGVSVIRGAPTLVLDLGALLGGPARADRGRLVTVAAGERLVALAVDEVRDVQALPASTLAALPSLVGDGPTGAAIEALATSDAALVLILRAGRLLDADIVALARAEGGA